MYDQRIAEEDPANSITVAYAATKMGQFFKGISRKCCWNSLENGVQSYSFMMAIPLISQGDHASTETSDLLNFYVYILKIPIWSKRWENRHQEEMHKLRQNRNLMKNSAQMVRCSSDYSSIWRITFAKTQQNNITQKQKEPEKWKKQFS